jgi:HSP20 family protein
MENAEKNIMKTNSNLDKSTLIPLVDIIEDKDGYFLLADMPGVSKENLELTLDNNELTILGKTNESEEFGCIECSEFSVANFKRIFIVNDEIDSKNISAAMENGILRLSLPKSEKIRSRKIEIKSA